MKIGFIGAGKVGFSLGKYFSINNITLTGYYSKSSSSSKEAAEFTGSKFYESINELIDDSDIVFITTPDDIVFKIWQTIKHSDIRNKIICHTSGSLSSKIFSDINNLGAFAYSIHPMFAFSSKFTTYKHLKDCYFSIEGDAKYLCKMKAFIASLGNSILSIDKDKKDLYHLANVTVSNLVLSLLNKGCSYLISCGVNEKIALNSLMPLIENSLLNLKEKGFTAALTGPIERNDLGTIKKHINAVPIEDKEIYKNLSLNLLNLSKQKHPERDYIESEKFLGGIE
ncbi:DUF2520 domain-containing protein [Clostridium sp. P21]|uniref:DUF2520 domain-containing protein n=1 Tax=Clostridium muellerianum TaxID=2716538 RepID=A0A7Y0EFU1_9CLOT|nr:DUF2520 domain-containing protein [Clostridium muellerianum]NMM61675.1 DUF2520 domain-containing protein [Clostridium muellerianum]